MSKVKLKGGKAETLLAKSLWHQGYRYRKNDKRLPGKPDVVLPKYKTVIFINGCFWHKHDCPRFVWPSSNEDYWIPKIQRNVERDRMVAQQLAALGWNVIIVWECQLKKKVFEETMDLIVSKIKKGMESDE